jgi:hypothetical protein
MIVARSPARRRRSGFGLVEMALTGVLIAAAMAATLQVVGWVALDRRATERRERAVVEVANLMERVVAHPWEEIETDRLRSISISDSARSFLQSSTQIVKVEPFDDAPARKKITIELRWANRSGQAEAPVRLVAWIYRNGGSAR